MTQQESVAKWIASGMEDLAVADDLFTKSHRNAHCLFFCQLALEKILKAKVIAVTDDAPPITHDLIKLAQIAHLSLTNEQTEQLREITTFNVEARYDIHKDRLYKKATDTFTQTYLAITKELSQWIQQH